MHSPRISVIAALGRGRVLGRNNELLWHLPEDLKRFKQLTLGHPVIMGRKTFDSILASLGKPLPGRANIVVTRDETWHHPEVLATYSLDEAFARAREVDQEEVFIIGGAQLYEQALPHTDRLYLTLSDDEKVADVFFPPYETLFTKKITEEMGSSSTPPYRFIVLEK